MSFRPVNSKEKFSFILAPANKIESEITVHSIDQGIEVSMTVTGLLIAGSIQTDSLTSRLHNTTTPSLHVLITYKLLNEQT